MQSAHEMQQRASHMIILSAAPRVAQGAWETRTLRTPRCPAIPA